MRIRKEFLVTVEVEESHYHIPTVSEFESAIEDALTGPAPEKYGVYKVEAKFQFDRKKNAYGTWEPKE